MTRIRLIGGTDVNMAPARAHPVEHLDPRRMGLFPVSANQSNSWHWLPTEIKTAVLELLENHPLHEHWRQHVAAKGAYDAEIAKLSEQTGITCRCLARRAAVLRAKQEANSPPPDDDWSSLM
jgi:hypothetical protein